MPAAGALEPSRRPLGELRPPTLRAGTIHVPKAHASPRVRVIATLPLPPLAAAEGRSLALYASPQRLDVRSASSRAYLARLARTQNAAVAALRREIPEARVSRRFRILLDGITVELPAARLPRLARLAFVRKLYPSLRYTLALNRSPEIIAASGFNGSGVRGAGMKIAIVDDGVDQRNRFFDPRGLQYPLGYPRGGAAWTTPKVIVARSFPGPGAGRRGRLALDRNISFHGTHVGGIAAGRSGTNAPPGRDHPPVSGLSGVAPDAWIGNYRVFTVPTPIGHVANTPEIVAAFEAAVRDGMHVINFSGGGPQIDPANDALIEAVENVAAAGVVPVISAGNDRDEFGMGTAGSPGTAPDAISVAAVSNSHVFAASLSLETPSAPASLRRVPFVTTGRRIPARWDTPGATLVDVGTVVGTSGMPVDRHLCGIGRDPNAGRNPLPRGSLRGAIALVSRGACTFVSKATRAQAAGAVGLVLVDNRSGEANPISVSLSVPAGMISDLDGARLREALAAVGGRAPVRIASGPQRLETARPGVATSFSSAGPTAFEHNLKPDVSAPGGHILSATLRQAGGPFAVFDGTSMAAPHVAGAAALLRLRHPAWAPYQVKSALMSTAGAAWANTARTIEAPVLLQGGGVVDVGAADDPRIFSAPASLSFGDLKPAGAARRTLLLSLEDAGGGAGAWQVELQPQSAGPGTAVELPSSVTIPAGGTLEIPVAARAAAGSPTSDNYGFVVLRREGVTRRIPYAFFVSQPGLALHAPRKLRAFQAGDTRAGASRASVYRYPSAPFGPHPTYTGPAVQEDGAERVYVTQIGEPVINFGVAVVTSTPGSFVDPWLLGSLDENDVEGYAGTPANVNSFTFNYGFNVGAAGAVFPRPKRFFVAVDASRDPFTGRLLAGRYVLRFWVDDVLPPFVDLVTRRVAAGRPTLVARIVDFALDPRAASGVDPTSIALSYRNVLLGVSAYDPVTGLAVFVPPRNAPRFARGRTQVTLAGADFQEAKNVSTPGGSVLPNTGFQRARVQAVRGAAVTWIAPNARSCVGRRARLVVAASATRRVRQVRFYDRRRLIAVARRQLPGVYTGVWRRGRAARGRHLLRAVVTGRDGSSAAAGRVVRVCRGPR
jgi:subtilisin family serine protease